ncbi:MAG: hypothetical protein M3295_02820 [Chloroflexota bacterium]|nr:hypothetical protein [Chloroflexota bacterium]
MIGVVAAVLVVSCAIALSRVNSRVEGTAIAPAAGIGEQRMAISIDLERVSSEADLIHESTVVAVGSSVGSPTAVPLADRETFADYYLTVSISAILRGPVDLPSAQIVWLGAAPGVPLPPGEDDLGPPETIIAPGGSYVLFLQPSATPGVFQVVGHGQGVLTLDAAGRVTHVEPSGFQSLVGLTLEQLRERINNTTS